MKKVIGKELVEKKRVESREAIFLTIGNDDSVSSRERMINSQNKGQDRIDNKNREIDLIASLK